MNLVPKLGDLLAEPGKAGLVPPEAIPAMLADLERLKATLWARLTLPCGNGQMPEADRRLSVEDAAAKLSVSKDWLYRHAETLPFTVRIGRSLGFSHAGIEKYLKQRTGR